MGYRLWGYKNWTQLNDSTTITIHIIVCRNLFFTKLYISKIHACCCIQLFSRLHKTLLYKVPSFSPTLQFMSKWLAFLGFVLVYYFNQWCACLFMHTCKNFVDDITKGRISRVYISSVSQDNTGCFPKVLE